MRVEILARVEAFGRGAMAHAARVAMSREARRGLMAGMMRRRVGRMRVEMVKRGGLRVAGLRAVARMDAGKRAARLARGPVGLGTGAESGLIGLRVIEVGVVGVVGGIEVRIGLVVERRSVARAGCRWGWVAGACRRCAVTNCPVMKS